MVNDREFKKKNIKIPGYLQEEGEDEDKKEKKQCLCSGGRRKKKIVEYQFKLSLSLSLSLSASINLYHSISFCYIGSTLVLGGDGRYFTGPALQTIIKMTHANKVSLSLHLILYPLYSCPSNPIHVCSDWQGHCGPKRIAINPVCVMHCP